MSKHERKRLQRSGTQKVFTMHYEIGAVVLGCLSAAFSGYGVRELAFAYGTAASEEWSERAVPGAGGVLVGALFALMTFQILV